MRPEAIQDRISRGFGVAGRVLGQPHNVFRPRGTANPLDATNRVITLGASFSGRDPAGRVASGYGDALRSGLFDTLYTRAGDYLTGPSGTFFIASQLPLVPALCVAANRTISAFRPGAASLPGANAYGGPGGVAPVPLLLNWPASVRAGGQAGRGLLPGDARVPTWVVLLPCLPLALRAADLLNDDSGRNYVVAAAEESELGWRLVVQEAGA